MTETLVDLDEVLDAARVLEKPKPELRPFNNLDWSGWGGAESFRGDSPPMIWEGDHVTVIADKTGVSAYPHDNGEADKWGGQGFAVNLDTTNRNTVIEYPKQWILLIALWVIEEVVDLDLSETIAYFENHPNFHSVG